MPIPQEQPEKTNKALANYHEVKARNPITGEIMTVKVEKPIEKTPEQVAESIKAQLKELKLEPIEQVEVKDPFTGKTELITIDRTGTSEKRLIVALADPNMPRERKDHYLSMYLYERGKDSMSMIVDIMRYKGQHSKESQVFQSRMRLDFESFVGSFTHYLQNQSRLLGITLDVNIEQEKKFFEVWLNKQREFDKLVKEKNKDYVAPQRHYIDFVISDKVLKFDRTKAALIEMAIYAEDEAKSLIGAIERIVQARAAMKGGGIYVDKMGRPYSVNDPEIIEVIKKEREIEQEANKDNGQ